MKRGGSEMGWCGVCLVDKRTPSKGTKGTRCVFGSGSPCYLNPDMRIRNPSSQWPKKNHLRTSRILPGTIRKNSCCTYGSRGWIRMGPCPFCGVDRALVHTLHVRWISRNIKTNPCSRFLSRILLLLEVAYILWGTELETFYFQVDDDNITPNS